MNKGISYALHPAFVLRALCCWLVCQRELDSRLQGVKTNFIFFVMKTLEAGARIELAMKRLMRPLSPPELIPALKLWLRW